MRSTVNVYLMRPEAIEAFFVLWRLTGKTRYREYGWGVFQAIEKWCKVVPQHGIMSAETGICVRCALLLNRSNYTHIGHC